jgi:hypothetical protein
MSPSPIEPHPPAPPATLRVPSRYCGPPGTANGGWIAGTLAALVDGGPVTVTLRRPTPLDVLVDVEVDPVTGTTRAVHDGEVTAEAVPAPAGWLDELALPDPVALAVAADAQARFAGFADHAFPHCFVCGTHREPGDGLRLFTGPVPDRPGTVAAPVHLGAAGVAPGGAVPTPMLWAALDCPTAWTHLRPGDALLLGRITAAVVGDVGHGALIAVAQATGAEGRKRFATSILHDGDGRLVAAAEATWFLVATAD